MLVAISDMGSPLTIHLFFISLDGFYMPGYTFNFLDTSLNAWMDFHIAVWVFKCLVGMPMVEGLQMLVAISDTGSPLIIHLAAASTICM